MRRAFLNALMACRLAGYLDNGLMRHQR